MIKSSILILFILLFCANGRTQKENDLNLQIHQKAFQYYQPEVKKKRRFIQFENATVWKKINPVNYLASGLLFVYQNVLSEQISANCSYEISCSEMTKLAIQRYGLVKGALIGIHQLSSCSPGLKKEHCSHVVSSSGKIINTLE